MKRVAHCHKSRRPTLSFRLASLTSCLWLGCAAQDSPPQVGTNTSWLMSCRETADCNGAGTCRCEVCTDECGGDDECGPGVCASELATNAQCGTIMSQRICLPASEVDAALPCTVLPVTRDVQLGMVESSCTTPGALLCESFDAPLAEGYSTWYGDEEIAAIQDCEVARGAGALRVQTGEFGYSQTRMLLASPVTEGALHVRFFGYFAEGFPIPEYLGLFELWTNEEGPPKIGLDAHANDQLGVNLAPFSSVLKSAPGVLRRGEWLCIELALDLRTEGGSVTLSLDGTPVIEETDVVTSPGEAFSVAVIEALPAEDSTGIDVAFDALVVALEPIGCD